MNAYKAVEDLIFELQMMQFNVMMEDERDCVEDIKKYFYIFDL